MTTWFFSEAQWVGDEYIPSVTEQLADIMRRVYSYCPILVLYAGRAYAIKGTSLFIHLMITLCLHNRHLVTAYVMLDCIFVQ